MQQSDSDRRVLFIDCAPWFGGAQRSLAALVAGLDEAGFRLAMIAADATSGGLLEQSSGLGVECSRIRCRHWQRGVRGFLEYVRDRRVFGRVFGRVCREFSPHLIHVNGVRAGLLLPRRRPAAIPVLLHARDVRLPQLACRMVLRRVSAVVAVSDFCAGPWRGLTHPTRVHVVHNGIDVPAGVPALRRWPWGKEHYVAVLVADMVPWKRHELFLDALRHAHVTMPACRGVVVGRPLAASGARRLAELRHYAGTLGLGDKVCFVTAAADALPWIAGGDVLVSTAAGEPFGRTVVEALALGKPVVAVRGGGPDEVLAGCDAGRLVAAEPGAIAAGLNVFREPHRRVALARRARTRARCFSRAEMVRRIVCLYGALGLGPGAVPGEDAHAQSASPGLS